MNTKQKQNLYTKLTRKFWFSVSFVLIFSFILVSPARAAGASLSLAPSRGTFFVGSTFSLSIYVNTKGNKINAVEVDLKFPPDILQVTSPTAGESFISEWLTPPSYSNVGGTISFKGGIPEGIVTSAGLISTITFRAKSPGLARVEFLDSSRVLLADGKGTPIFATTLTGIYEILMPPPEGPKISSPTHYDPDIWYSNPNPSFYWEEEPGITDFSFTFSQNPEENPDTVSEGHTLFKSYEEVSDGIWYFHLRAKKAEIWGKPSHFVVKIDTTPPKEFTPQPDVLGGFIYFDTIDTHSGIDHYEISVLDVIETPIPAPFFVEATSPYKIPFKKSGKYSVIVRVYDRAGNLREGEVRFQMLSSLFSYIEGKGIEIKGVLFSLGSIYLLLGFLIIVTIYLLFHFLRRRGLKKSIREIQEALREIEKIEEQEKATQRLKEAFEEERRKLEEKLR